MRSLTAQDSFRLIESGMSGRTLSWIGGDDGGASWRNRITVLMGKRRYDERVRPGYTRGIEIDISDLCPLLALGLHPNS